MSSILTRVRVTGRRTHGFRAKSSCPALGTITHEIILAHRLTRRSIGTRFGGTQIFHNLAQVATEAAGTLAHTAVSTACATVEAGSTVLHSGQTQAAREARSTLASEAASLVQTTAPVLARRRIALAALARGPEETRGARAHEASARRRRAPTSVLAGSIRTGEHWRERRRRSHIWMLEYLQH